MGAQNQPVGPKPDEIIWEVLRDSKDEAALDRFVAQYPTSRFRPQAEQLLAKLMEPKPTWPPQPSPEDVAWGLLRDTKDAAQLHRFLDEFPKTVRRGEAEQRLASLAADAEAAAA